MSVRIAVMCGSGGPGKTDTVISLAINMARDGLNVGILDLDFGNPTLTQAMVRYRELETGQPGDLARIKRNRKNRTIFKFLDAPDMDLDTYALRYPLADKVIPGLANCPRLPVSQIDASTLTARTIAAYGFDPKTGQILLVPNQGGWESYWQQQNVYMLQNGGNPYIILKNAFDVMDATRAAKGQIPIDAWLVDSPGEQEVSKVIGNGVDHVVFVFDMTMKSVTGIINTADELTEVRNLRGQYPLFDLAIPNKYKPAPSEGNDLWIQKTITPMLAERGIAVSRQPVTWSVEQDRAGKMDVLMWEYDPTSQTEMDRMAIYRNELKPLWGLA